MGAWARTHALTAGRHLQFGIYTVCYVTLAHYHHEHLHCLVHQIGCCLTFHKKHSQYLRALSTYRSLSIYMLTCALITVCALVNNTSPHGHDLYSALQASTNANAVHIPVPRHDAMLYISLPCIDQYTVHIYMCIARCSDDYIIIFDVSSNILAFICFRPTQYNTYATVRNSNIDICGNVRDASHRCNWHSIQYIRRARTTLRSAIAAHIYIYIHVHTYMRR